MTDTLKYNSTAAAFAAGALVGALTATAIAYQTIPSREPSAVETALTKAGVPFIAPGTKGWAKATQRFNQRLEPVIPLIVVRPTTAKQVQKAVAIAASHGLKVSAKSGGHSYGNFCFGEAGTMVINLDQMYGVTLHSDNSATVRAGSRLGHVATELYRQGKRGISHGSCPSVGLAGHALHGGYGFSSNKYGLALDWITGMHVVLADGSQVYASRTVNKDLFWAMRGAGSSFGIAVRFNIVTFPAPEQLAWMKVRIGIGRDRAAALAGLKAWQEYVERGVPEDMTIRLFLSDNPSAGVFLEAMYFGSPEKAREVLEPLTEPLELDWEAESSTVHTGNWPEHVAAFNDRSDGLVDVKGADYSVDHHYASSLLTRHIPDAALEAFVDYWFNVGQADTRGDWWIQMDIHGGKHSGITRALGGETSFPHRDKMWLFQFFDRTGSQPDYNKTYVFLNGFMDAIRDNMPAGDWGRYANYADSQLGRAEALEQYYADSLPRLRAIKAAYDPEDMFHSQQSVDLPEAGGSELGIEVEKLVKLDGFDERLWDWKE